MKLSKKSRYGLRALIDLSVNSTSGHVTLSSIAERNQISPQYLEQVFASLRRAKIVRSVKGPQGGYLLNDAPENISVAFILETLEGTYRLEAEEIPKGNAGSGISTIIQKRLIDVMNRQMDDVLQNLTLGDLEKDYQEYTQQEHNMYYI